jgi:hypothetical protein
VVIPVLVLVLVLVLIGAELPQNSGRVLVLVVLELPQCCGVAVAAAGVRRQPVAYAICEHKQGEVFLRSLEGRVFTKHSGAEAQCKGVQGGGISLCEHGWAERYCRGAEAGAHMCRHVKQSNFTKEISWGRGYM